MRLNLKQLGYIAVLAEELNFGRAADRVHLSQSAFSRSIQVLEEDIGLRLFDRGSRHVHPTEAGTFIVARANQILKQARLLQHEIGLIRTSELGDVTIGVSPSMSSSILPEVLVEMRRRHPSVTVRVEVNNWQELLNHLLNERIEFFISSVTNIAESSDITITRTGRNRGTFFCRRDHPLLKQHLPTLSDIKTYGIATARLPPQVQTDLRAMLGFRTDENLPMALECDNLMVVRDVVLRTDALMFCLHASIREDIAAGNLVELPSLTPTKVYTHFGIVQLADRTMAPATALLMKIMAKAATQGAVP